MIPFVIDNQIAFASEVLRQLLNDCKSGPVDIATAYFNVGAFELVKDELPGVGALRLLLGKEPEAGGDVGLHAGPAMAAELSVMAFDEKTLKLVESLIAFLREDKVAVRAFVHGFLHAKAYLFHQDKVGPTNWNDRLRPYAAVVGSSNFTRPGLTTNKELNLVHRVYTNEDPATDAEAANRASYLREKSFEAETMLDPSGENVPAASRLAIKSEVGARAIIELNQWFERNWVASEDWKDELIDLLNRSKFGQFEYSPYQVYLKALYTYLKDQLEDPDLVFGRTAVELTAFQEDAVKKALRILQRYSGVLVADSVGLGKTWIGLRLLEHFAYLQRMKALVVCPASIRKNVWKPALLEKNIAAEVLSMEEMGREEFDTAPYGDADVILIDESHNFRNDKANRYAKIDELIRRKGGFGRSGERKRVILLSATPINNDLNDLLNQVRLFTQNEPDYFREAGIGDVNKYFAHARRMSRQVDAPPAGELLFNLLDEFVVRNTRPYIRVAYPNATINGAAVKFPERSLKAVEYSLQAVYDGLYQHVVDQIEALSLAPYQLEGYKKAQANVDDFERGREEGLVGIFKTRFLKRLESSVEAFRLSVHRALVFEQAYLDFLLNRRVVASRDFWKLLRLAGMDGEDELATDGLADQLESSDAVKGYLDTLEPVDLNDYDLRKLVRDVERDVEILKDLSKRIAPLAAKDSKLEVLKTLLAGPLKGQKTLIFTSYKDTARYLHSRLNEDSVWLTAAGDPHVRQIDSKNHPDERGEILKAFAPMGAGATEDEVERKPIDVLISTDVLSEGQNLQDCGTLINYDLTWNPIRLVQRNGRIDRLKSPHDKILILNMFPEGELENLLGLVARLTERIGRIDDLGFLDASTLGEVVHPRAFNTLRRIQDGDVSVLDEEEARAELAGPEMLLKQLKEMMSRDGVDAAADLPDGIHSGLRRQKAKGLFFYFTAPRSTGDGSRHFWRYVDAQTGEITDNRYTIAQLIACGPTEPRYIGDQDVFALQEKAIEHILQFERITAAKAVVATAPDKLQRELAEEIKNMLRRTSVDRVKAKRVLQFLDEPFSRSLINRASELRADWLKHQNDQQLIDALWTTAEEFGRQAQAAMVSESLQKEHLHLVCFDFIST